MKSKKVKKILLIALTCAAVSTSVSAEAAMKSQITVESKNKYEQLKISESRVYGEYPTGDYKKITLLPSVSKVEKFKLISTVLQQHMFACSLKAFCLAAALISSLE